ncbi:hypothetical protein [Streptomyces chiangmaiensis]|uniref:Integral membrane protein n=1 Tax=Streptomyces chiangmaiensis TaxID=766497 RepID=A0ABU7FL80_9ACTN|nr:hypothetical protein [Streptomyces chiangmaiensis]MED7824865.1 hypothetical protein [Streptomyces chiangmaiensis]
MTDKLLRPMRTRPWYERWLIRLLGAALAAGAYLLFLPWDLRNRPAAPRATEGTIPVTGAGVLLLAFALLLLAAYFGHWDHLGWPLLLVAVPPAVLMHLSLRTHPEPDASFWPLAWGLFTLLIAAGVFVAAGVARAFRGEWAREDVSLTNPL